MKDFFKGVFSDGDQPSFSRCISLVITFFVLGWDTSYVHHSHALPDAATLMAQGGFCTIFYCINRTSSVFEKK